MHGIIVTPKYETIKLTEHEMRRLFSLARTGLMSARDRGIMTRTDVTLEDLLNGDRVKF